MKPFFKYSTARNLKIAAISLTIVGLFSCKREIVKPELLSNVEGNNYGEVFQTFWNGMNSHYLFWDKETVAI